MTTLNTDNKVLDAARLNVASVAGASASDHANNIKTAERFGINPAFADSPGINMRAIIENQRDVLTKLYATDQRFAGVTQGDHDNLVGVADSAKSLYGRNQPGPITAKQIASLLRVQGERPELPVGETTTTSRVGLLEGFSYGQNAVVRKGLLVYKQQQGGGLSLDEQNELDAINAAYPPGTETPDGLVSGLAFGVMSMTPFFKEALRSPADYKFTTGVATIVGAGTVSAGVGAAGGSLGGPAGAGVGGTLTFAGGAGTAAKLQAVLNIAKIEYGLAFDELSQIRDSEGNKLDPALVRSLSTLVGGINGGLEMVQFRVLAKSLGLDKIGKRTLMEEIKKSLADATTAGALKKIARKQAVTGFEQGGLESLQEITNILAANIAERLSASPDNTFREDAPLITKENVSRITDAFQVGFAASVAFQSPATAVHIAASFTDAGKTEAANDAVRRLHAAAEKTRTKSIRPEALEQLVNEASPDKQMYLSTDDANVLLQEQPEAMEAMGVTSEVVAKAEATGDSIPVTPGKMASKLSKGQLDAVLQHTRPDADGVSEAEIESQETKEATKELKAVIDRTTEPERAVTREIERISKELTDIGASKEQVAANVSLLRGFADRMAFEGRDAAAIVGGIRIAGPDAPLFLSGDGLVLNQEASESFFSFRRDTSSITPKYRDASGKIVLFQGVRAGNTKGQDGPSGFYTQNPRKALLFANNEGPGGVVRIILSSDLPESVFSDDIGDPVTAEQFLRDNDTVGLATSVVDEPIARQEIPAEQFGLELEKSATLLQAAPEGDTSGDAAKPAKKKAIIGQLGLFGQKSRNPKVRAEAAAKPQTAPRGAVVIAEDGYIIKLLEGADASTLPHELAHVFFIEMDSLVSSGQASRDLVKAMAEIRKWMGLKIDGEIERKHHEQFADGFTKWLSEGKAPNAQLDAAFNRFRRWLSTLFRRIRNAVTLTPEVRDAMARFISVEDEVRVGRYEAGVYALSEAEMKALGMTEDDRRKAQQYVSNASSGAASDILKKREKQRAKRVKRFRTAARKIVDASRPHQVMRDLTKEGGLDLEQLRRRHGDEVVRQLREKSSGFVKKDGRNIDAVAQQHGYGDADLMVRELMEAETPGKAIDNIVNDALARFDSLFGAKEAVQLNAEWSKYLDHVARFLKQATGRTEPKKLKAAFIRLARGEIARLPINQATRTDRFTGTAQRLIREQNRAIVKGDLETALVKNRQARLQLEMARESVKIRDIRAKLTRAIKRSVSAPLGKIDERYHDAIRQLGHRAGVLRRGTFPLRGPLTDLSELVQPQDGSERLLGGPSFSPYLLGVQPIPLKNMTVGQAKELVDLVKYLDGKGREVAGTTLYVDGREIADVVAELIEPLLDRPRRKEWDANSAIGKTLRAIQKYRIAHDSMAFLLQQMDNYISVGAKNKGLTGKHEAVIERVLRTATLNRRKMQREAREKIIKAPLIELEDGGKVSLEEYIGRRSRELHDLETSVPVFEGLKTKGVYKWTFEHVFSLLLNRGNEHNLNAIVDGYNTTVADVDKIIGDTLNDNDIAAAQAIWDMLDTYKGQLQEVHRKLYHYSFKEVEPTPFTSKSGKEYRGGYFPLKFDAEITSRSAGEQEAIDAQISHMSVFQKPVQYEGFFNERLGSSGGRPVWLDGFQVFSSHIVNVVDTIVIDEPLLAVSRVFRNPAYQAAVVRAYGTDTYDAMLTNLNLIKHRYSPSDKINKTLEKALNYARSSTNAYILSGPETIIKQPFALVNFAGEYGMKAALSGVMEMAKHPYRSLAFVRESSEQMRQRGQLLDRDLETRMLQKLGKNNLRDLGAAHRTMVKIALAGLRFMDMFTATAAWMGAFNQRMELNGGNVEDAIQAADRASANTQGSSLEIDLSPLQLSEGGLSRLFTYFSTFVFLGGGVLSRRGRVVTAALKAGRITNTQFAFQMFTEFVIPPVMMNLLVGYLRDDDPDIEDIMLDLTLYQFSGLFVLRDLTYYGGTLVKGRGNTRQSLVESPSLRPFEIIEDTIGAVASLGFAMADDSIDPETRQRRSDRAMFAAIRLASFAAGIPVSEYYDRFEKGRQQIEQDDTLFRQMLRVLTPSRDPERDEE